MTDGLYDLICCAIGQHTWLRVHDPRWWKRVWPFHQSYHLCTDCGVKVVNPR